MNLKNTLTFYFSQLALKALLAENQITEDEYKAVCRQNAEILQPDRRYIQWDK